MVVTNNNNLTLEHLNLRYKALRDTKNEKKMKRNKKGCEYPQDKWVDVHAHTHKTDFLEVCPHGFSANVIIQIKPVIPIYYAIVQKEEKQVA